MGVSKSTACFQQGFGLLLAEFLLAKPQDAASWYSPHEGLALLWG